MCIISISGEFTSTDAVGRSFSFLVCLPKVKQPTQGSKIHPAHIWPNWLGLFLFFLQTMETTGKATMEELRAFATENQEYTDEKTGKTVKIKFLIGGTVR